MLERHKLLATLMGLYLLLGATLSQSALFDTKYINPEPDYNLARFATATTRWNYN